MRESRWLMFVALAWLGLSVAGYFLATPSTELVISWLVAQQLLLALGGYFGLGSKGKRLLRWDLEDLYKGIIAGVGLFLLNIVLSAVVLVILGSIYGFETVNRWLIEEQSAIQTLLGFAHGRMAWLISGLIVIGASLSEELFFRGLLLDALRKRFSPTMGVTITALVFALVHFYVIQFLPVLVSGIILGRLFLVRQNLLRPIVAHSVVNGLVFLVAIV